MRKLALVLFLFTTLQSPAQFLWQLNKDTIISWHYQWGDEFTGNRPDTSVWDYSYGWSRSIYGNKEQQYYSDGENHRLTNGVLNLNAERRSVQKKVVDWRAESDSIIDNGKFNGFNKRDFKYIAGLIQSKDEYRYGYFEIKFKMPAKKGYWPAFWLYGGDPNEEIDWMELKTEKKNSVHVGRHSTKREENYLRDGLKKRSWGEWVSVSGDLTDDYNIIAGEWNDNYIKYYLNGECIAYTKLALARSKKIVANIAVPANNGPFKPGPADSILFSGDFEIDYIRVWTKENKVKGRHQAIAKDTLETTRQVGFSKLRSKRRFIYGLKSEHQNEGITVSLLPESNATYRLMVLGQEIPPDAQYRIKNLAGLELASGKLMYGTWKLNLPGTGPWQIELSAFGRATSFRLNPLRTVQTD